MKVRRILAVICVLLIFQYFAVLDTQAATYYESDNQPYEEGYIFVGESHVAIMASTVSGKADEMGKVPGLEQITYLLKWDGSRDVTEKGYPNTFVMKGNLYFVFEGIGGNDAAIQTNINYLYSDGNGKRGRAVERIHEIIDGNPNIKHWTIISFTGGVVAKSGAKGAQTYVKDYQNWINYEFPDADIYIMSQSTMTKYYRSLKDPEAYNRTLAAAFPNEFLDYTDFFRARYPQGMRDPRLVSDTVHWSEETYFELFKEVIHEVDNRRQAVEQENMEFMTYETVDVSMLMYTNEYTQLYQEPFLQSKIVFPSCEQGCPIQVTGITTTGFYRVKLEDGEYFIPEMGLSSLEKSE